MYKNLILTTIQIINKKYNKIIFKYYYLLLFLISKIRQRSKSLRQKQTDNSSSRKHTYSYVFILPFIHPSIQPTIHPSIHLYSHVLYTIQRQNKLKTRAFQKPKWEICTMLIKIHIFFIIIIIIVWMLKLIHSRAHISQKKKKKQETPSKVMVSVWCCMPPH